MSANTAIFFTVIFAFLCMQIAAVDKSKFRTCEQASFCQRARAITPRTSGYSLDPNSLQYFRDYVTATLLGAGDDLLEFRLSFYEDGVMRVYINEKSPWRVRYEPQEVLMPLTGQLYEIQATNGEICALRVGKNSAIVTFSPFMVEFYADKEKAVVFNGRGQLNWEVMKPAPEGAPDRAEMFGTHRDSRPYGNAGVSFDLTFEGALNAYGLPEHASSLALQDTKDGEPYRLYNLDVFEYEVDSRMALYGAVPLVLAQDKAKSTGAFFLNTAEMFIDVEHDKSMLGNWLGGSRRIHTHWMAETGVIDVFVMLGPRPADVLRQYTGLTGRPPLPQRFATAYHQCRWNYKDEADVLAVNDNFNSFDIPMDVLWLDIEYTDSKKYFTWDKSAFPRPVEMQKTIADNGRKMVTIIDPHIKRESGYFVHDEALTHSLYVRDSNNAKEYEGFCWPGPSSWMDYVNPSVRDWWAKQFSYDRYVGSTPTLYIWNDMNEPSQFNGPEITMHKDALHHGGWEHRDVHNIYGLLMVQSTFDGLVQRNKDLNDRPFVLTRSFFAGVQRYAAVWNGDNAAQWSHLSTGTKMLLSLGVAGVPFVGADVGGFFGNPDPELLVRYYQVGAFYPFFRAHAHIDTKRREPWLFGEPYTSLIRNAIRTRYALLPYWYTQWWHASVTGAPIMRPLFFEFPEQEETFAVDDAFMVGPALLVKPVEAAGQVTSSVYLPGSVSSTVWYDYRTYSAHAGGQTITVDAPLDSIPVFIRGGSIIVRRDRARRASSLMDDDPFTLLVALDRRGEARGDLYLDDGRSYNYKQGEFLHRDFVAVENELRCTGAENPGAGSNALAAAVERVVVMGVRFKPSQVILQRARSDTTLDFDFDNGVLTIRKPWVSVAESWSIQLKY